MSRRLIAKWQTPQVTALEYDEYRDLEKHPEKGSYYKSLIDKRTAFGRDFETKAPSKKKKKRRAA